ncbi:MAG: CvpA family protein [Chloroflexota bacterium]
MPGGLPALDFLMLTVLTLFVLNGARRGFIKESAMLVGVALSTVMAGQFGPMLAKLIWPQGAQAHNTLLAYLSVLVVVLLIVAVSASMIRPVLKHPTLRTLDLVAGLGLGACEGLLLLGAASSLATRFGMMNPDTSRLGPSFANLAVAILSYLPANFSTLDRIISTSTRLPLS